MTFWVVTPFWMPGIPSNVLAVRSVILRRFTAVCVILIIQYPYPHTSTSVSSILHHFGRGVLSTFRQYYSLYGFDQTY